MKQHNGILATYLTIPMMLLLFTVSAPTVRAACNYQPGEWQIIGPVPYYAHVRNGNLLDSGECWDGSTPMSTITCGTFPTYTLNTFNFNGYITNRLRTQYVDVPGDLFQTRWELVYSLTANDPHQDSWWTTLKAEVINVTDGGTIASHTWWGDDPPLSCGKRRLLFQGNFAGKRLQIRFEGRNPTPADTVIRVGGIELMQY